MRPLRNFFCLAVFSFCATSLAAAQQPAQGGATQPTAAQAPATAKATADTSRPTTTATPQTPQQKQLADDTAKLLALANELKTELDKSSKDTLSLSVIRKAEQVEKLAHKVRDEMKGNQPN